MGFAAFIENLSRRFASWRNGPSFDSSKELGDYGENLAARFLRREHGYKVLVRQWKSDRGEIDLIARDREFLAFIEVKTRTRTEFGLPQDAVNQEKQRRLSRAALEYLRRLGNPDLTFRFDIVEVQKNAESGAFECRLIQNAFPLSKPYRY
ncbi:MAG: YraN family protein [Verrucomicrobiae bacterium]|nr:YraN family protein [Verrucomicrobiae bacterium]